MRETGDSLLSQSSRWCQDLARPDGGSGFPAGFCQVQEIKPTHWAVWRGREWTRR